MTVLSGVRVVDFGHHVAGPLLALMLADQGADVVRVDRPGVAPGRHDAVLNRGKRRITLDLKRDLDTALALVARADVVVENFRPGVMDRLGLGAARLRAAHPRLVYCSLPGFAAADPRAGLPAWEGVVAAATGNCRVRAGYLPEGRDPDSPVYAALPVASNFAAFCGAFAVVAALTERHRTGRGDRIEVPLFHAMFEAVGGSGAYPVERGLLPERAIRANGSGTYRCADGRWVQFNPIGATPRFRTWFLDAAGAPEADDLTGLFLTRTAQEWEDLAHDAGVPLAMVRTAAEWRESTHARESGEVAVVDDPLLGPTAVPGPAVWSSRGPAARPHPRSLPDGDRAEILAELGADVPESTPTGDPRPPYAGLNVLDLTQILAGPTAGRVLAEFGAEVTKVNSPQRRVGAHGFVNRGKRTVLLDVKSAAGQQVLWKLIERADVLTHNFPGRTAESYGLGYHHVRARRPDIVYVSVGCYGRGGPWSERRGYETQGQAATGIMALTGGDGPPAVFGPYNVLDYGTGLLAAFAAALGLHHRAVTGEGQHVHASLTQTGLLQQAGVLTASERQRYHRAADGWFFLGVRDDRPPPVVDPEETVEACVRKLVADGHGAHAVVRLADLMTDPLPRSLGLTVAQTSEEVGEVVMPGIAITAEGNPPRLGAPVRRPGADARAVLADLGLAAEADTLAGAWAVQLDRLPSGWDHF
ncbi:CaiB/BaiF CoA-transferase family protein [Herbidospora yilanensis]|uniref:CaiB/BaiF CoA-transferase family protein n=1 Tax=Herbidospora yilanensis TaxID=354426 RepID=UPI000783FB77|nr:CoA transferase [Herbidospora yilanensis]